MSVRVQRGTAAHIILSSLTEWKLVSQSNTCKTIFVDVLSCHGDVNGPGTPALV
jgi:hypothetical protein